MCYHQISLSNVQKRKMKTITDENAQTESIEKNLAKFMCYLTRYERICKFVDERCLIEMDHMVSFMTGMIFELKNLHSLNNNT